MHRSSGRRNNAKGVCSMGIVDFSAAFGGHWLGLELRFAGLSLKAWPSPAMYPSAVTRQFR